MDRCATGCSASSGGVSSPASRARANARNTPLTNPVWPSKPKLRVSFAASFTTAKSGILSMYNSCAAESSKSAITTLSGVSEMNRLK